MKKLKHILFFLGVTAALAAAWCTAAYAAVSDMQIEVFYDQGSARSMLSMINSFRTGSDAWAWNASDTEKIYITNLSELQYDYELEKAAMKRAAEIALLFSHTRPDGTNSYTAGGWGTSSSIYGYTFGENIAAGSSAVTGTFAQWREDSEPYAGQGHRRNMLSSDFTAIGIGHVVFNGRHFWVQQFGAAPHTTETEPAHGTVTETISVEDSFIATAQLAFRNQVSVVNIPVLSDYTPIPEVRASVTLRDSAGNSTWPGNAPVIPDLTWTSSNPSVVSVEGGILKGQNIGNASVSTSWRGITLTLQVRVTPIEIGTCSVSVSDEVYTGSELYPEITVTPREEGAAPLTLGTDFYVTLTNNVNAGTGGVRIDGKGIYAGTIQTTFTISKADITQAAVAGLTSRTYSGSAQTPDYTVTLSGRTLAKGTDFTESWADNINAGNAKLTLSGSGNYQGTIEKSFVIQPISLSDYEIASIDDVTYTGSAQKPAVVIPGLPDGAQVTAAYADNISAGNASVTVNGLLNCTGTLQASFKILPKSLAGAAVAVGDQVYTGEELTPPVTVTLGGVELVPGTDYMIPANGWADNLEKGMASVRVTGIGNYTGFAAGSFRIGGISLEKALEEQDLMVLGGAEEPGVIPSEVYTGGEHKPEVALVYRGETLVEGTDYTRTDSENVNAGEAKITLAGKDRFEEEITLKYRILPADISGAVLKAANYTYSGKENKPVPTVTLDGTKLVNKRDFEIMRYATNVNAGNGAVRIRGIGNYTGEKVTKFKIAKLALSKAFKIASIGTQYYTGSAVTPSYKLNRIEGMEKAAMPVAKTDFTVSWQNNKKVSTTASPAALVLTATQGSKNYTGSLKITFKIVYRPKNTAFTTTAGSFKITKTGPSGTAEVVFVKPKNAQAAAQKVPDKVTWQKVTYKVTSVAAGAFKGNKYMTSLSVGSLVTTIGANAFSGCPKLKSVVLGGAVKTIGKQAFYKDSALKAITIRSKLLTAKTVGAEAFKGIYAKAYIKVPAAKVKAYRTILTGRGASGSITIVGA